MSEWEIDLLDEEESVQVDLEEQDLLPRNLLAVGEIRPDDEKIYIRQDVYRKLQKFSGEDTSRELGSILLGQNHFFQGNHHVVIQGYLEARYVESSASTLTFTHQTWEDIHKRREEQFKSEKIVGWHHTHPGYGIFLSRYDIFIQENYFNLPWQLAYVIDPVSKEEGFFVWKEGQTSKLHGFYLYDEIGSKIDFPSQESKRREAERKVDQKIRVRDVILLLLLTIAVLFSISLRSEKGKLEKELAKAVTALADATNAEQEISVDETEPKTDAAEEPGKEGAYITFYTYTVKQGDTLESICLANGLDDPQDLKRILKHNSIQDPDLIYAGEELILPVQ